MLEIHIWVGYRFGTVLPTDGMEHGHSHLFSVWLKLVFLTPSLGPMLPSFSQIMEVLFLFQLFDPGTWNSSLTQSPNNSHCVTSLPVSNPLVFHPWFITVAFH